MTLSPLSFHPALKPFVAGICALVSFSASSVLGAVVGVDWGGSSYVASGTASFTLATPTDSGGTRTYSYSLTTPISPIAARYSGPAIYGALQHIDGSGTASGFNNAGVTRRPNGDNWFLIEGSNNSTAARSISGLIFFKKEDFLNGYSEAQSISFAEDSTLQIKIETLPSGTPREVHFAVLNGDNWYISEKMVGGNTTFTLTDVQTSKWALWDPSDSPLATLPGSTAYTFLGSDLADIQAVGFYFVNGQAIGTSQRPTLAVSQFSASFEAIPEPSVAGILALGSLVFLKPLLSIRRKH